MSTKSLLVILSILIAFAAGYQLSRYLHSTIVIAAPAAHIPATQVQLLEAKKPVTWPNGGGRLTPGLFPCIQSIIYCWWST